jgi:hypothetical protein
MTVALGVQHPSRRSPLESDGDAASSKFLRRAAEGHRTKPDAAGRDGADGVINTRSARRQDARAADLEPVDGDLAGDGEADADAAFSAEAFLWGICPHDLPEQLPLLFGE